jgi:hypothetical protein
MRLILKAHEIHDGATVMKPTGKTTYRFVKNSGVPLFTEDGKRLYLAQGQYLLVSNGGIAVITPDCLLALDFTDAQEVIDYLEQMLNAEDDGDGCSSDE